MIDAKKLCFILLLFTMPLFGQQRETANDFNTPLHLLQPAYKNPYNIPSSESVKKVLDRILDYLEKETPAQVIDTRDGKPAALTGINSYSGLQRGAFRLASYEWGVTYAGMLLAGETTRDKKFTDYTLQRLNFLCETAPYFRKQMEQNNISEPQLRQLISPQALDDAGSMCAAFIKTAIRTQSSQYKNIINNYIEWIMHGQMRLGDGTLARNRPHYHTLWLDDMFMSIPALAWMGKYSGDNAYYDEAIRQIRLFASRMFVPEKNLFMHGWVESMDEHPAFFWGRANGWAVMTLVEVLEVLPKEHPGYNEVMDLLKKHIKGIAALQSGDGRWHQLLDRNDSYLETSATAIYTYAIARAVNRGWIDAKAYGPRALSAWNAISGQVNDKGQIEGVCVGTGMGFDPAYYDYRPVHVFAAHGYGPVLLAGAEITALLQQKHPKMNDSAVQFYDREIQTDSPIFEEKPAPASHVGKRYPSEKKTIIDSITGRPLTVLTASTYSDAKPYQTHDTWTSDGQWIIFRSQRGGNGSQLFVVNEITGDIVQLTDDPTVSTGSLNLSRKEMKLFFMRGDNKSGGTPRQIVELNIGQLLRDALSDKVNNPKQYERIITVLPSDMRGDNMALDADETRLYLGISLNSPQSLQPEQKQTPPPANNRSSIDNRNTDPSELRETARARFEEAGKGKSGIRAIDIRTGKITKVIDVDLRMGHLQANPWTPGEIIYCHETTGDAPIRIWTVKADGSNNRPAYLETPDEWVTHETVSGPGEVMFNIMGHLPYLREKPTGIAVVNLRNKQMKLLGQVEEDMGNGQLGGFWHSNGSPDGRWATGDTFKGSIYLINRHTGDCTLLTTGHRMKPDHTHPIFSPDSKRILIQSGMLSDGKALNLMVFSLY